MLTKNPKKTRQNFDQGLTLEPSALLTLYGGQFILSTQLMKRSYRTEAATQFF